jgi:hypothetical protein
MTLRVIPATVHTAIDYATAPVLLAAPTLLRVEGASASARAPRLAGGLLALLTPVTDTPLAAKRWVPMRAHLAADALTGIAVAAIPWATGQRRRGVRYWLPHAVVGAGEIGMALLTRPERPRRRRLRRLLRR